MAARRDARSERAAEYRRLYRTARWQRIREAKLSQEPLCRYCLRQEIVEAATVCDHIDPHKGDEAKFFDPDNVQSLCARCHDSVKQREEMGQVVVLTGVDGYPM